MADNADRPLGTELADVAYGKLLDVVDSHKKQLKKAEEEVQNAFVQKGYTHEIDAAILAVVDLAHKIRLAEIIEDTLREIRPFMDSLCVMRARPVPAVAKQITTIIFLAQLTNDEDIRAFANKLCEHYVISNPGFTFSPSGLSGYARMRGFVLDDAILQEFGVNYDPQKEKNKKLEELNKIKPLRASRVDCGQFTLGIDDSVAISLPHPSTLPFNNAPILKVKNEMLTFNLGSNQAPLDKDLTDSFSVTNMGREDICLSLENKTDPECKHLYSLKIQQTTPSTNKLAPHQMVNFDICVRVHCTCKLDLAFSVIARRPKEESILDSKTLHAPIQSELSIWMDPRKVKTGELVGEGAFGKVYRGEFSGMEVAVKVFSNENLTGNTVEEDFKQEAMLMQNLSRHQNVVQFIGAIRVPGSLSLVTEFCQYGSVFSAMKHHHDRFTLALRAKVLLNISYAVQYLHDNGVIHRDLKPDNALIVSLDPSASCVCKLSDFGTTRAINTISTQICRAQVETTPIFAAPEVLRSGIIEKAGDVYAFGLCIWSVFTEKNPFDGEKFPHPGGLEDAVMNGHRPIIPSDMPEVLADLTMACWDNDASKRPEMFKVSQTLSAFFNGIS